MKKEFQNILVVSDNAFFMQAFQKMSEKFDRQHFNYTYSTRNKTPELLIQLGAKAIDVKKECYSILKKYDLVFSLHCKQIFPEELVNKIVCINLHPGLNPYNRGWYPQVFSILNGLPAGATLHQMIPEIDRGPVIDQLPVKIEAWDTSLTAYNKIRAAEVELLNKNLESILFNRFSTNETEEGNYNGIKDFNALTEIDLNKTGSYLEVIDTLRALSHPPFKNAYFITKEGKKVFLSIDLSTDENKT